MREIKFAAFLTEHCQMGKTFTIEDLIEMGSKPFNGNVKWLQYAGFHDESGDQVEVFESDIVELEYEGETHICEVKYEGSGFMFVADSLADGYLWASEVIEFDGSYCWAEGVRVVGNVHSRQGLAPKEGADKHE
ncbi:YopX family protein [Paenibacillus xylanexedens]|uniref:YopX protein domain-containing protein n=1 Tax=Paenibacillus xylanexedens TaxID=528191 RepID=A0ABS4RQZ0_PAEXY|nr:YopX family protein [Paenibacillus xylanexedens]MBP2245303.1 hypothetical protein [Paenibacillus xylanexedens]